VPGDSERLDTLSALLRETTLSSDVLLDSLAVQTAALVARDLVDLVGRAENAALDRVSKTM
jgi:peroxin-6